MGGRVEAGSHGGVAAGSVVQPSAQGPAGAPLVAGRAETAACRSCLAQRGPPCAGLPPRWKDSWGPVNPTGLPPRWGVRNGLGLFLCVWVLGFHFFSFKKNLNTFIDFINCPYSLYIYIFVWQRCQRDSDMVPGLPVPSAWPAGPQTKRLAAILSPGGTGVLSSGRRASRGRQNYPVSLACKPGLISGPEHCPTPSRRSSCLEKSTQPSDVVTPPGWRQGSAAGPAARKGQAIHSHVRLPTPLPDGWTGPGSLLPHPRCPSPNSVQ